MMPLYDIPIVAVAVTASVCLCTHLYVSYKLRRDVAAFRAAFEFAPVPMFMKDAALRTVAVNAAFTEVFGISMTDIEGLTASQQGALWSASPLVDFAEQDRAAIDSDEVLYSVTQLLPPRPDRSTLRNTHDPQEYFISRRRFLRKSLIKREYWIVGAAKSVELMLQFADKARARHEEIQSKSPILSAITELKNVVQDGFQNGASRFDRVEQRLTLTETDLGVLMTRIAPELVRTVVTEKFSDFET